jgi:hypothetical protein
MAFSYRYPKAKLRESDDYLKIDFIRYKPPGLGTQGNSFALNSSDQTYAQIYAGKGNQDILGSVILPIPEGISDQNSAEWGTGTLNPLESGLYDMATGAIKGGAGSLFEKGISFGNKVANAAQTGVGQGAIQGGFAAAAVQAALGKQDSGSIISRAQGVTFNQNIELLFSGIQLRSPVTFQFDMVPRDDSESKEIKEIIRNFKYYSAAKKGLNSGSASGLFLKSPEVFRLQYMSGNKQHPFLNKFKICALTSMGVNYTASGTYATYSDATPVHMQLTLTFQELTPIYAEDYESGQGKTGVGY